MRTLAALLVLGLVAGCASGPAPPEGITWGKLALDYADTKATIQQHVDVIRAACAKGKLEKAYCTQVEADVRTLLERDKQFRTLLQTNIDAGKGGLVDAGTLGTLLEYGLMAAKFAAIAGIL